MAGESGGPAGPAHDPLLGRVIGGKLELTQLLGSGAMGKVYRAHHRGLDKTVAIKVLHRSEVAHPDLALRFQAEARAASRLDHPNSLRILDFGEDGDDRLLYIAMEFLDGEDLARVIRREGRVDDTRTAEIMVQVMAALAVAHQEGVVHRDMKPGNIMLLPRTDDDGLRHDVVKVCDFGLAKILDAPLEDQKGAPLTKQGMIMGTPAFMSPEQATGSPLDGATDVYACGVILYQMLTGRVPFTSETTPGVLIKHLTEAPPPILELAPDASPELAAIAHRALAKNKAERYTAREMMVALRAVLQGAQADLAWMPDGALALPRGASAVSARARPPSAHPAPPARSLHPAPSSTPPPPPPPATESGGARSLAPPPVADPRRLQYAATAGGALALAAALAALWWVVSERSPDRAGVETAALPAEALPAPDPVPGPARARAAERPGPATAQTPASAGDGRAPSPERAPPSASTPPDGGLEGVARSEGSRATPDARTPLGAVEPVRRLDRPSLGEKLGAARRPLGEADAGLAEAQRAPADAGAAGLARVEPQPGGLERGGPGRSEPQRGEPARVEPPPRLPSPERAGLSEKTVPDRTDLGPKRLADGFRLEVTLTELQVGGGLSVNRTTTALERFVPAANACLRAAVARAGVETAGSFHVSARIDQYGALRDLTAKGPLGAAEGCVASAFATARLPKPDTGEASVRFTLRYATAS